MRPARRFRFGIALAALALAAGVIARISWPVSETGRNGKGVVISEGSQAEDPVNTRSSQVPALFGKNGDLIVVDTVESLLGRLRSSTLEGDHVVVFESLEKLRQMGCGALREIRDIPSPLAMAAIGFKRRLDERTSVQPKRVEDPQLVVLLKRIFHSGESGLRLSSVEQETLGCSGERCFGWECGFRDVDGDGKPEFLWQVFRSWAGGVGGSELSIFRREGDGFLKYEFSGTDTGVSFVDKRAPPGKGEGWSGLRQGSNGHGAQEEGEPLAYDKSALVRQLIDLDSDGRCEVIVPHGFCDGTQEVQKAAANWPTIYKLRGMEYQVADSRFPEFYREKVLPLLDRQEWQFPVQKVEVEAIRALVAGLTDPAKESFLEALGRTDPWLVAADFRRHMMNPFSFRSSSPQKVPEAFASVLRAVFESKQADDESVRALTAEEFGEEGLRYESSFIDGDGDGAEWALKRYWLGTGVDFVLWIFRQEGNGFSSCRFEGAERGSHGYALKDQIVDLDGDGRREVLIPNCLDDRGAMTIANWPTIYRWDGESYRAADSKFPDFYRMNLLPHLKDIPLKDPDDPERGVQAQALRILVEQLGRK